MKKITICITFKQWGNAFINLIGTSEPQWEPKESSCHDYSLNPGSYDVTFNGQSGGGFEILATDSGGNQLGHDSYDGGEFSGHFIITVN